MSEQQPDKKPGGVPEARAIFAGPLFDRLPAGPAAPQLVVTTSEVTARSGDKLGVGMTLPLRATAGYANGGRVATGEGFSARVYSVSDRTIPAGVICVVAPVNGLPVIVSNHTSGEPEAQ